MATNFATTVNLPAGRIVSGSPTYKQDKEYKTGKPKDKPNWFMAVAVPKMIEDPVGSGRWVENQAGQQALATAWNIATAAYQHYGNVMQAINQGMGGLFKWKIEDGDASDNRGKEGYAGCYIWKFSTTLGVMKCCDQQGAEIDPSLIKCGYYVDVRMTIDVNELTDHNAGLYLNPNWVRFLGFGPEISPGPTPAQAFEGVPAQLPAGASATPIAPQGQPGGSMRQDHGGGFGGGAPQAGFGGAASGFGGQPPQQQPAGGFGGQPPQQQQGGGGFGGQPTSAFGATAGQPAAGGPGFQSNFTPAPSQGAPAHGAGGPAAGGPMHSPGTAFPAGSNQGYGNAGVIQPNHGFATGGQR